MILMMILQDNMEEKKITSLRAVIQERAKALQFITNAEKKPLLQSRMKELMEKAKQARLENKGTKTVPSQLREKMLARQEQLKNIISKKQQLKNKEVQP